MDKEYVEKLQEPAIDMNYVIKEVRELVKDKSYTESLIDYAITNFLKSLDAYKEHYDADRTYYRVSLTNKDRNLVIFHESLAHLLGLPNYRYLQKAVIINDIISRYYPRLNSRNALTVFTSVIKNSALKEEIIDFDIDPNNENEEKLNWDKIAYKVFCFLNLGVISEKETFSQQILRNRFTSPNSPDVILTRQAYDGLGNTIRLELFEEDFPDGKILVPRSIRMIKKDGSKKIVNGYRSPTLASITMKGDTLYAGR